MMFTARTWVFMAFALLVCLGYVAAAKEGLRITVEKASARSKRQAKSQVKADLRNPALIHELSQVMGPKSFEVPEGYDKMARPYKNGPPCNVTVGITIKRIADVNDKEGSVVFDLMIFTQWRDPRLKGIAFKRILPKDVWTPAYLYQTKEKSQTGSARTWC